NFEIQAGRSAMAVGRAPPASSRRPRRPPAHADRRVVRDEGQVIEPIERPDQGEVGYQGGDRRSGEESEAEIGRAERQQRGGRGPIEREKYRLQNKKHHAAIEIERERRAGDEQELKGRADQTEPQGADLPELHVERIDYRRRRYRDQRADNELR